MNIRDHNPGQNNSGGRTPSVGLSRPRRDITITHRFVEFVPKQLDPDTLYISMEYATAIHLCACGCGTKVVTPFAPNGGGWTILYDGEKVTLSPSIGNWSFPCRSHYFIRNSHVHWARDLSKDEITFGRQQEQLARKDSYNKYNTSTTQPNLHLQSTTSKTNTPCEDSPNRGLFTMILNIFRKVK